MDKQLQDSLDFIDNNKESMLLLWEELVNIESGPDNKQGVDTIILKLKAILEEEAFDTRIVEFEKAGNTLIGELGINRPKKSIAFLGHVDTVFPKGTVQDTPFKIEDGKAYGPGVLDMKGGIVSTIYAIKALNSINYNRHPLKVVFTGTEEVGHVNSSCPEVIINESKGCLAAFNSETGFLDNGMVIGRKGALLLELEVEGISAHTGNAPEKGRNAILEISHKVIDIQNLTDYDEGTIYNVGVIEGGSTGTTVPDYATAAISVRYLKLEQKEIILKQLEEISAKTYVDGTKTKLSVKATLNPMENKEENNELFKIVKESAKEIGLNEPHSIISGGGSDAAYPTTAGVPTVCALGPQGEWNHTLREYAIVESLFERTKLLVATILNIN